MTSPANNQETEDFFATNNYFGLSKDHVMCFSQSMLPCFSNDEGKLMLETPTHLAMAAKLRQPDGCRAATSCRRRPAADQNPSRPAFYVRRADRINTSLG